MCKSVSSQVGRLPATSKTPKVRSLFYSPEMTVWSWYPSGTSCSQPMGVAGRGRRRIRKNRLIKQPSFSVCSRSRSAERVCHVCLPLLWAA